MLILNFYSALPPIKSREEPEFGFKHAESFSTVDYDSVSMLDDSQVTSAEELFPEDMEELKVTINLEGKDLFPNIVEQAEKMGLAPFKKENSFKFPGGMAIYTEDQGTLKKAKIFFSFSPQFWQAKFNLVTQLISIVSESVFLGTEIECAFPKTYEVIESQHRVGGLLMDMDIGFSDTGLLTFCSMPFKLGVNYTYSLSSRTSLSTKRAEAYVSVTPVTRDIDTKILAKLLQALRSRGAIAPPTSFLVPEL